MLNKETLIVHTKKIRNVKWKYDMLKNTITVVNLEAAQVGGLFTKTENVNSRRVKNHSCVNWAVQAAQKLCSGDWVQGGFDVPVGLCMFVNSASWSVVTSGIAPYIIIKGLGPQAVEQTPSYT